MSDVVVEASIQMTREMLQKAYPTQYLKTQQNREAPVSKLPTEIFLRIFTTARDAADHPRTTLHWITLVCRDWRDIAITAPLLWTRYLSSSRPKWTRLTLQRTQLAPLAALEIDIDLENGISDISKELLAQISHTSKIKMTGRTPQLIAAHELVEDETSFLKELEIFCTDPHDSDTEDEPGPVFELAPTKYLHTHHLRRLKLGMVDIHFNSPLLQNLTTLSLHRVSPGSLPTWSQLNDMLHRMPLLTHLELEHVFPVIDSSAYSLSPVYLPLLESLSITSDAASQMQIILTCMFFLRPKDLQLKWNEDDIAYISTFGTISIAIHAKKLGHTFDDLDVEFLAYDGRSLDFSASSETGPSINVSVPNSAQLGEPAVVADFIDSLCMKAITSLTLYTFKEYGRDPLLPLAGKMPFLQDVTISLSMAFDFFEVLGMTSGISQTICFPRLGSFNFLNSDFLGRDQWVEKDAMHVLSTRREHDAELECVYFHYVDDFSPEMVTRFEEEVEQVCVFNDT